MCYVVVSRLVWIDRSSVGRCHFSCGGKYGKVSCTGKLNDTSLTLAGTRVRACMSLCVTF